MKRKTTTRQFWSSVFGLGLIVSIVVTRDLLFWPLSAKPLQLTGDAKTILELKQMRLAQTILSEFINDLTSESGGNVVSAQQAEQKTKLLIRNVNDNKVLADIALAARFKLNIYLGMPERDRLLWQALYASCVRKLNNPDSRITFLLNQSSRDLLAHGGVHKYTRSELNSSYKETHRAIDLFLDSLSSKTEANDVFAKKVAYPIAKNTKSTDDLTYLATNAHTKFSLYQIFYGTDSFYDLFCICCLQILTYPGGPALDAIDYMGSIFQGAATSEFLSGCKSQLLKKINKQNVNFVNKGATNGTAK